MERGGHQSRPRLRPSTLPEDKPTSQERERESSVGRDVDKDPMMIEQMKKERAQKYASECPTVSAEKNICH